MGTFVHVTFKVESQMWEESLTPPPPCLQRWGATAPFPPLFHMVGSGSAEAITQPLIVVRLLPGEARVVLIPEYFRGTRFSKRSRFFPSNPGVWDTLENDDSMPLLSKCSISLMLQTDVGSTLLLNGPMSHWIVTAAPSLYYNSSCSNTHAPLTHLMTDTRGVQPSGRTAQSFVSMAEASTVLGAVQLPSERGGTRGKYYYQRICEEEMRLLRNWLRSCDFPVIFPQFRKVTFRFVYLVEHI